MCVCTFRRLEYIFFRKQKYFGKICSFMISIFEKIEDGPFFGSRRKSLIKLRKSRCWGK